MSLSSAIRASPWRGETHAKPLVVFIHGDQSEEITSQLGEHFKARVIKEGDAAFKEDLLEGIERCFNLLVLVANEKFNPKSFCAEFVKETDGRFIEISILLKSLNVGKEGYSFTIAPQFYLVRIFLDRYYEKQKHSDKPSLFLQLADSHPVFHGLSRIVNSKLEKLPSFSLYHQFSVLTSLNVQLFNPAMRPYLEGVDFNIVHRPYPFNEMRLPNDKKISASFIQSKNLDGTCPNFIATGFPFNARAPLFWTLAYSQHSTCLIQLNSEMGCFFPQKEGEVIKIEDFEVSLLNKQTIIEDQETLLHYTLSLTKGGAERQISAFWIKNWQDGQPIRSEEVLDSMLNLLHDQCARDQERVPIVFCTAGIGRTGTFIGSYLIKHLMKWSTLGESVDTKLMAFYMILFLRMYRSQMVHSQEQFNFLNRLITHYTSHSIFEDSDDD